jgi:methylenetetrahydrofolate dehydrogenase (NADP+)/methenyltetrahydrofolate cyclohydrolase
MEFSGGAVLRDVRASLAPYRSQTKATGKGIVVVRFTAEENDPVNWRMRMEASRVSADQKIKAFSSLGFRTAHKVLPGHTSRAEFADMLHALNKDPRVASVIVQYPPPPDLSSMVPLHLSPAKDIDGLLGDRSPQPACATAEGIARVVSGFADERSRIAVVGANGFVGGGVQRLLRARGADVVGLDTGDDLRAVRDADIVVSATGRPGLLGDEHIHSRHRLVVDSGFMPSPDGGVSGDVRSDLSSAPRVRTPVPGGIGPVEMAVLMERVVRQECDPNLKSCQVSPERHVTTGIAQTTPRNPRLRAMIQGQGGGTANPKTNQEHGREDPGFEA